VGNRRDESLVAPIAMDASVSRMSRLCCEPAEDVIMTN
jgi:hypothetical protein